MDYLSLIKEPIEDDLKTFNEMFSSSFVHSNPLLSDALTHISKRIGKQMRPILILLVAKVYGIVNDVTLRSAVGLELLHTASLVHDDVVDESVERRGQPSLNAIYDNEISVLVGDYLLSTALLQIAETKNVTIIKYLSELGRTLASGEILQLSTIQEKTISEEVYYNVISQKTAALFEACCSMAALSNGITGEELQRAKDFGRYLGLIFQIRDDIFDYYDSTDIGKPTGKDMLEGKLTLPVIYALNTNGNDEMISLAYKVKLREANSDDISRLVAFAKEKGGIEYAEESMEKFREKCDDFIVSCNADDRIKKALFAYVDMVINRWK